MPAKKVGDRIFEEVVIREITDPVGIRSKSYQSSVSFARPADVLGYTAGDVIGVNDAGSPGSAIHYLGNVGPAGGYVIVQSVSLVIDATAVPSGMAGFRLHFYDANPTAIVDNSAFDLKSADRSRYLGYVDLGTPQDLGSVLYSQADYTGRLLKLGSGSSALLAQLQTLGAYTPGSATAHEIRVGTLEVGL